jgi:DNA-binding GntR family transcriptional regulator
MLEQTQEPANLHQRLTSVLRDRIVDGILGPGTPISERELCEEFEVSRTPLREALKVLASEGLVQLFRNRGAIVTPVSLEMIGEKLSVLIALEGYAARQVCLHASDEELEELAELHRRFSKEYDPSEPDRYFDLHQAFHLKLLEIANNPALTDMHTLLSRHVRRPRVEGLKHHIKLPDVIEENGAILRAVLARDTRAAQLAVEKHLGRVTQTVIKHFRQR